MDIKQLGVNTKLSNCEISTIEIDDSHYYFLFDKDNPEGKFVPSVTNIIDEAGPVGFGLREFWKNNTKEDSEEILAFKGDRGKRLHKDIEYLFEGLEVELEDRPRYEKDAISTYVAVFRFLQPKAFKKEQVVASPSLGVAGTLDFVGVINDARIDWLKKGARALEFNDKGELVVKAQLIDEFNKDLKVARDSKWILDNKFTGGIFYAHECQVAGYKGMYNESRDELPIKRTGIWRYSPKHKLGFEFKEVFREFDSFKRLYETYLDTHDGEIPQPPTMRSYPKTIKLLEKI